MKSSNEEKVFDRLYGAQTVASVHNRYRKEPPKEPTRTLHPEAHHAFASETLYKPTNAYLHGMSPRRKKELNIQDEYVEPPKRDRIYPMQKFDSPRRTVTHRPPSTPKSPLCSKTQESKETIESIEHSESVLKSPDMSPRADETEIVHIGNIDTTHNANNLDVEDMDAELEALLADNTLHLDHSKEGSEAFRQETEMKDETPLMLEEATSDSPFIAISDRNGETETHTSMDSTKILIPTLELPSQDKAMHLFHELDIDNKGALALPRLEESLPVLFPGWTDGKSALEAYRDICGSNNVEPYEFTYCLSFLMQYQNILNQCKHLDLGDGLILLSDAHRICETLEIDLETIPLEIRGSCQYVSLKDVVALGAKSRCLDSLMTLHESGGDFDGAPEHGGQNNELPSIDLNERITEKGRKISRSNSADSSDSIISFPSDIPDSELKYALLELFDSVDRNCNGSLSLAELSSFIEMRRPQWNHGPAIQQAYLAADRDMSGFIERDDFPFLLLFIVYYNTFWRDFSALDDEGNRKMSKHKFRNITKRLRVADAMNKFVEMDTYESDFIYFDEFCAFLAKHRLEISSTKDDLRMQVDL